MLRQECHIAGDLLVSIDPSGGSPGDSGDDSAPAEEGDDRADNGASRSKTGDATDDLDSNPVLAS